MYDLLERWACNQLVAMRVARHLHHLEDVQVADPAETTEGEMMTCYYALMFVTV